MPPATSVVTALKLSSNSPPPPPPPPPPSKRDQPPCACYCAAAAAAAAAAVVYTRLRKEPCEPGGNCVKSPCELPVRWLADRCVAGQQPKQGGRGGGSEGRESREGAGRVEEEEEKEEEERVGAQSEQSGSCWQTVAAREGGCLSKGGKNVCLQKQ